MAIIIDNFLPHSEIPAEAVIDSLESTRNDTHTKFSIMLSKSERKFEPDKIMVEVANPHSVSRLTLDQVSEFEAETQPGENYNITITTINAIGQTVSRTSQVRLPASGIEIIITKKHFKMLKYIGMPKK